MADVFEDHPALAWPRLQVLDLIRRTPELDWLLLTKRPENVMRLLGQAIGCQIKGDDDRFDETIGMVSDWMCGNPPSNVWMGTTVEDRKHGLPRIEDLKKIPARVRFLSCEPLLEDLRLRDELVRPCRVCNGSMSVPVPGGGKSCVACLEYHQGFERGIDWVIIGGESGPGARPFDLDWARSIRDVCKADKIACFVKQLGAVPTVGYYDDAAREWFDKGGFEWPDPIGWDERDGQPRIDARVNVRGKDRKGGDPSEWPADLRVRQFPEVRP
jgi:protein gp37